jgi:hypothetical protein
MNINIQLMNDTHILKYMGPVANMLTEYELDNHLNQIPDISKRELFKNVRNWAYKKYKMFVTANFNTDGSVESISIGFANMSITEVDEVFCTLFRDKI